MAALIYVSSTEHSRPIQSLGIPSTLPEEHGCDILVIQSIQSHSTRIGFQRKAAPDFISSLADGRLSKELAQIESSTLLTHACLILEGRYDFTTEGQSTIPYANLTRKGYQSILTNIQSRSIIVQHTTDARDTADTILHLSAYLSKPRHSALSRRPSNTRNGWGVVTSKSFSTHLLQSFPGIGAEMASRIYDHFSTVPLQWSCTESELRKVPGIGKKLARQLIEALAGNQTTD